MSNSLKNKRTPAHVEPEPTEEPIETAPLEPIDPIDKVFIGVPKKKPKTSHRVMIEERRRKIQKFRIQGLSQDNIAKILGVNIAVIKKDMQIIRKENKQKIDEFQQAEYVGEGINLYDEVIERAWGEYFEAKPGTPHRLKSLSLVKDTQREKFVTLTECGLIVKEPQKMEVAHTFNLPWDDSMKDAVARTLLQRALKTELLEPTPDGPLPEALPPELDMTTTDETEETEEQELPPELVVESW
jgi:hypothetical protein